MNAKTPQYEVLLQGDPTQTGDVYSVRAVFNPDARRDKPISVHAIDEQGLAVRMPSIATADVGDMAQFMDLSRRARDEAHGIMNGLPNWEQLSQQLGMDHPGIKPYYEAALPLFNLADQAAKRAAELAESLNLHAERALARHQPNSVATLEALGNLSVDAKLPNNKAVAAAVAPRQNDTQLA